MTTLLERFIPEAREYLESAATGLLKLERTPGDDALINEVFRAIHTLKGASGLFDIPGLTRLVHAGEDLLGAVRSGQLTLDSQMVDLLLDALDRVSAWIDALERHGHLPADAEGVSVELSRGLRAFLPEESTDTPGPAPVTCEVPPDWLDQLSEADRLAAFRHALADGSPLLAISYQPDEGCFYRAEDPFNLLTQLSGLQALAVSLRQPPPLPEADPFCCLLSLHALTAQPHGEVEHLLRYVIDQTNITAVPVEALVLPVGSPNDGPVYQDFVDDARRRLERLDFSGLKSAAATLLGLTSGQLWVASVLRWLDAVLAAPLPNPAWAAALVDCIADGVAHPLTAAPPQPAAAAETPSPPGDTMAVSDHTRPMAMRILGEQMRIIAMPGSPEDIRRRSVAVEAMVGNLLSSLGWSVREGELSGAAAEAAAGAPERLEKLLTALLNRVEAAAAGPAAAAPSAAALLTAGAEADHPADGDARPLARILKVEQSKVDALMTLIAELVVSKNSLPFLAKRAEDIYGSREMGREIKDQYAVIDRLAQEMQRAIMAVRMLPVSEVFERFPRLVRDLSRKLNKRIELKISGEETAADKTIIESLGDPLIHLVRNALDHGIESPEQRLAAGKPETATIQLKAFQESDQVVIEISDDGKGIDPVAIRVKAMEKGLIGEEKAEALSDQDAINLIFLPGFSTAKEISDLSGRGVGMDVVRTAIEKINGQVLLSSRKGEGTLVRLSLPLSMAVTRVMMVEVGDTLFGIPMDGVAETVRVPRDRIRRIKRSEAFVLREAIVPMVRMHDLLGIPAATDEVEEEAVLVARVGGITAGLVVDRFREGIDVILKPMDGLLAGIRGYSGTALLGDGRVLLVLNLKELL